jgi:ABC-type Zn uptake system ZnuABC Zn-binding protein ZnuA
LCSGHTRRTGFEKEALPQNRKEGIRMKLICNSAGWAVVAAFATLGAVPEVAHAQQVCATTPDLAALVREIGGEQVSVTAFAKGTEDPHFVEARPSFVRSLNQANLLVHNGLFLEAGWLQSVLQGARNSAVLPGGAGNLDASQVIQPLEIPTGRIDRAQGDVHPGGNPHYMTDPIAGLKVAALIRDKLIEMQPGQRAQFAGRYDRFAQRLAAFVIGEQLAEKYTVEDMQKLCRLHEAGRLRSFLESQKEDALLGGWLGLVLPYYGTKAVDDHNIWPYFARRFGIQVVAHLEPKPGIPPTTSHLGAVVTKMRAENTRIILASVYYDPRHANFVASQTGARVVSMANQVGARSGTADYISMIDYNVRQLVAALEESP